MNAITEAVLREQAANLDICARWMEPIDAAELFFHLSEWARERFHDETKIATLLGTDPDFAAAYREAMAA